MGGFGERYFAHLTPNEPMIDYMRELRERGYKLAICTNNVREWEHRWRAMLPGGRDLRRRRRLGLRRHPQARAADLRADAGAARGGRRRGAADRRHRGQLRRRRAQLGIDAVWFQRTEQAIADTEAALQAPVEPDGPSGRPAGAAAAAPGCRGGRRRSLLCDVVGRSARRPAKPGADGRAPATPSLPAPIRRIAARSAGSRSPVIGGRHGRSVRRSRRGSSASRSSSRRCGPTPASDPAQINPVLVQLIRNLTPGQAPVLRIGGDSTDVSYVTGAGRQAPALRRLPADPRLDGDHGRAGQGRWARG